MIFDLFRSNKNGVGVSSDTGSHSKQKLTAFTKNEREDRETFAEYSQQSMLPSLAEWPSGTPLLVVASNRANDIEYNVGLEKNCEEKSITPFLPNGCAVTFEGSSFEGKLVSRIKDVPASSGQQGNLMSNCDYFRNRSRQYQWCVQGRFKRRIRFDEIVTGQEFGRPFRNAPSSKMVKKGLDLLKHKLPETFECDLFSEEPRFEHPLLAGCQSFRVDKPEDVEGIPDSDIYGMGEDGNVIEDTALLDDNEVPQDGISRRKYFSKNCNLEQHYFEPHFVYTFDFFANFFSPARHRLELTPFFSIDLIPYFNGYPLFMSMAKEKSSGQYLWATEMWHKRLLNYDENPGRIARLFTGSESRCEEDDVALTVCETEVEDESSI